MSIIRTQTEKVNSYKDSGTYNGWNLRFSYETKGEELPTTINVTGTKDTNKFFNLSQQNGNTNLSFSNASFDASLVTAVIGECEEIAGGLFIEEE